MNAEHVVQLLNAHWIGKDRFAGPCPIHGGKSKTAVKGRVLSDRIVLHDFAGCDTADVLQAAGLTWADLFPDTNTPTSERKELDRNRTAAEGLEKWRQSEIQRCAENLRSRDTLTGAITAMVRAGTITQSEVWDSLEFAYSGYSELEYKFDRLLHNENVLDLWRESRGAA